ncbi:MAG: manganese-binding transcriptional regulator MntR [Phycisphaerae bacterium]|jgi:DtxR family manganese transport transcriptional regulator
MTRKNRSSAGDARASSGNRTKRSSTGPSGARRIARPDAAAARQAAGYNKIRRDHSSEIAQDYVELIAQLIRTHGEARTVELAQRLGVSHVTVNKTVARLQREGLVRSAPYRSIFLTDNGRRLAELAEQRHKLVAEFLRKLGVNEADADADAEGIEHHISDATLAAISRFVHGSSAREPDGR